MRTPRAAVYLLSPIALLFARAAVSQTTDDIRGTVADASGAPLPGETADFGKYYFRTAPRQVRLAVKVSF